MKKQDTSQTQQPHSTIITSAPTSPFQHKSRSTTTSHIQSMLHSTPIRNSILTPTKSQSKYSTIIMILYACTNEKYLIPISVPILPHTTPQDRITPHTIILHSTNILTVLYKQHSTFFLSTHYLLLITVSNSTSPQTSPPLHYNSIHQTSFTLPTTYQTPTQTHLTSTSTHTTHHSLHHSNSYSLQSCHTTNTHIHKPHTNHKLSIII